MFSNGFSEKNTNLADLYTGKTVAKGEGVMGRVWLTGMPSINEKYEEDSIATLLMPVINQGMLKAVVVFCLYKNMLIFKQIL